MGFDYDRAPTDPSHGGKLTEDQLAELADATCRYCAGIGYWCDSIGPHPCVCVQSTLRAQRSLGTR